MCIITSHRSSGGGGKHRIKKILEENITRVHVFISKSDIKGKFSFFIFFYILQTLYSDRTISCKEILLYEDSQLP